MFDEIKSSRSLKLSLCYLFTVKQFIFIKTLYALKNRVPTFLQLRRHGLTFRSSNLSVPLKRVSHGMSLCHARCRSGIDSRMGSGTRENSWRGWTGHGAGEVSFPVDGGSQLCPHGDSFYAMCKVLSSDRFMINHSLNFNVRLCHRCLKHFLKIDLSAFLSPFSLCSKCMSVCANFLVFCSSVLRKPLTCLLGKNWEFFL